MAIDFRDRSLSAGASRADTEKSDRVSVDAMGRKLSRRRINPIGGGHVEIQHRAAAFAHEMAMGARIGVVASRGKAEVAAPDAAFFQQDGDVAIDATQAQAGNFLPQPVINVLGGGMGFTGGDGSVNPLA